jgi:hypothetical protein
VGGPESAEGGDGGLGNIDFRDGGGGGGPPRLGSDEEANIDEIFCTERPEPAGAGGAGGAGGGALFATGVVFISASISATASGPYAS